MVTDDLIEDSDSLEQLAQARLIILNEPLALDSLITQDLRHTRIVARVEYEVGSNDIKMSVMEALRAFSDEQQFNARGYPLRFSGQPVFGEQFEVLTQRDQSWINPVMMVLMLVILFASFRSVAATLLPWLMIGAAIVLVSGIQGVFVWPHTVVESALIPTLMIIGIGVGIHVLVEFYQGRTNNLSPTAAAEAAIQHLWVPVFYTALTTAAGFLALGVTELIPVRQFAWLGAIGAMTLFILSMTLLPALLSFVNRFSPVTQQSVSTGFVARITLAVF
jgi:predicted RND superfamily exporter protein